MKSHHFLVGLSAAILVTCTAGTVSGDSSGRERSFTFTLTPQNIVSIDPSRDKAPEAFDYLLKQGIVKLEPGADKIRAAFDYDGGQFQVLIPKEMFPIPAPNCKRNVILRMPGTDRNAPGSDRELECRWQLFQSLHAAKEGGIASIEVPIEVKHSLGFAPYMRLDKQGNPTLEWCNAYIDANSMNSVQ